jgi:hypothetical protein
MRQTTNDTDENVNGLTFLTFCSLCLLSEGYPSFVSAVLQIYLLASEK